MYLYLLMLKYVNFKCIIFKKNLKKYPDFLLKKQSGTRDKEYLTFTTQTNPFATDKT